MLLAGALGVLLTLSVLRSADDTQPVLVAARDLAPGTTITDASVRVVRIHADPSVLATLLRADQLASVRGRVASAVVHEGQLIARTAVATVDAHRSSRIMSFPLPRARAVSGRIDVGDRVDVIAVDHDSRAAGYVLTDAEVVGVDGHTAGALSGSSDDVTVTLVVDPVAAPQLASAIDAGTVSLVRSTGAPALVTPPTFVAGSK